MKTMSHRMVAFVPLHKRPVSPSRCRRDQIDSNRIESNPTKRLRRKKEKDRGRREMMNNFMDPLASQGPWPTNNPIRTGPIRSKAKRTEAYQIESKPSPGRRTDSPWAGLVAYHATLSQSLLPNVPFTFSSFSFPSWSRDHLAVSCLCFQIQVVTCMVRWILPPQPPEPQPFLTRTHRSKNFGWCNRNENTCKTFSTRSNLHQFNLGSTSIRIQSAIQSESNPQSNRQQHWEVWAAV